MLSNANFLCEIGTEEIPAGYVPAAIAAIEKNIKQQFQDNRIDCGELLVMATPRRFAVLASELADKQREETSELKGPAVGAAYNEDGTPAKPLIGFMQSNGLTEEDIFKKAMEKGEYVFAKKVLECKNTEEILPHIIKNMLAAVPFPKRMRWADKTLTFPRPVDYFALMLNDKSVAFDAEGIPCSNAVRGHYVQHNQMLPLHSIADYEQVLRKHGVIVNQNERKSIILEQLKEAAANAGCNLADDDDLLNTVTYIVENPHVVTCEFNKDFLNVPEAALIAEMKENQKYFPLYDVHGKLCNKFLVVANNPATDFIKQGNERVITARFSDARFFYEDDRKHKLGDLVDSLKSVLFHKELGSVYDKVERMQKVASVLCDALEIEKITRDKINRAIYLCKADLNTAMVFEFASLQGKMGRIYALEDGEDAEVANAIEDHYRPRSQEDDLPVGIVSVVVSVTEKIDNIFGSFSVGNIPKGSADPYALRRQANAIVEMLVKNEINISLKDVFDIIASGYKGGDSLVAPILDFIAARAKTIFAESGFRHDEIDACLSCGSSDFTELYRRAKSLSEFRQNEGFSQLLVSFKRMNNITQSFKKENPDYPLPFNPALLKEPEEQALNGFFDLQMETITNLISQRRYLDLFQLLTQGKSVIDAFFDKVLVMDEHLELRDNRLALLCRILDTFAGLMDFSKISDK